MHIKTTYLPTLNVVGLYKCRLSGLSPFMGDTDVETLSNVSKGKYDFAYSEFDKVSSDAKDFISKLLVTDKK